MSCKQCEKYEEYLEHLDTFLGISPCSSRPRECFILDKDKRIAELEQQLASLQWQEITEGNLPKVGPYEIGGWFGTTVVFDVAHCVGIATCDELLRDGWTHFRAIAAPPTTGEEIEP